MRVLKPAPGECVDRQTILELKMKYGQAVEAPEKKNQYLKGSPDPKVDENKILRTVVRGASKINIKPFDDEHRLIQRHMDEQWAPMIAADTGKQIRYNELYKELLEVNEQLWKLEDQARLLDEAPDAMEDAAVHKRGYEILKAITRSNDKRSELVKQINAIWNISSQEKMYA